YHIGRGNSRIGRSPVRMPVRTDSETSEAASDSGYATRACFHPMRWWAAAFNAPRREECRGLGPPPPARGQRYPPLCLTAAFSPRSRGGVVKLDLPKCARHSCEHDCFSRGAPIIWGRSVQSLDSYVEWRSRRCIANYGGRLHAAICA